MDLSRYFSLRRRTTDLHGPSHSDAPKERTYLPLIANPINEDVLEVVSGNSSDLEKTNSHTTTFAGNGRTSRGNIIIYKEHTEASTIELFYDLFFVANLAYFTAVHQHTDAESLINYLKLFTLMWFTWLGVTLFDVRFSIDCVWNRFHKAIQFGIFTAFVYAGPVFDKYSTSGVDKSYRNFAIVLVIGRIAIAAQYAVVMWQGRMFRQTLIPLGLSAGVHLVAAVGYGISLAVFPRGRVGLEEQLVWVIVSVVEGLLIFLIAMIWRIISFKYTHLVERLQLLTLIIIGEGIIGLVKSVACITNGQTSNNMSEIGTVVAAVLLLYFLWMLYFDQHSHDRFGTVRQQIWAVLHYPLHSAILLCVEGNTSIIVWNSAVQALKWIWSIKPEDYSDPADGYSDTYSFLDYLNKSMIDVNGRFKHRYWNATYNWNTNFTTIENYTDTYGFRSEEWNNRTGEIVRHMFDRAQVFVYEAHADSLAKLNAVTSSSTSPRAKLDATSDVFNTTAMQFFIGAGCVLLVLAMMYWFNKVHKTKHEFGEIISRVVAGFILIILGITVVIADKSESGFKFKGSHWIIPIVVLFFAGVLLFDNILIFISQYTRRHSRNSHNRDSSWGRSTLNNDSDDKEFGGIASKYPSRAPSPGGTPRGTPPRTRGHTPAPSLSRVQTAYTSYLTASPRPYEQALRPSEAHSRTPSRSPGPMFGSEVTLRDDNNQTGGSRSNPTVHDFSYDNTPTSKVPENQGQGLGMTVHPPSTPSIHNPVSGHVNLSSRPSGNGLWDKASWENLGVMKEDGHEGRSYGDVGLQQPMRARTVSFGDHGHVV
ncbi:hypothetical protein DDE83_002533 [Stemphylium lycopersici]|uniref:Low temperature requirement a protein n=1 Tax=Stemphylium lycopersici TaxID=183478 RepID=A0A364N9X1_STELY|nr:hypothetical protein DDE83_002533 [Stemphylium lycopersici]